MLSSQAEPLFSIPPTVPWRAPVAPLRASAILHGVLLWKVRVVRSAVGKTEGLQRLVCLIRRKD